MRLRLRWWREVFFLGVLALSLVVLLPLRFAVDRLGFAESGLTAREAVGSVWLGALAGARFGPLPLGDVAVRLRALPLLGGRARLDLDQDEGLSAGVTASRHGFGVDDASGSVQAPGLAGLPPSRLDLGDVSVRFADGLCASAEGRVTASGLSGEARCAGPALLLPLASRSGADRLDVRLFADGRYRIDSATRAGGTPYSERFEGRF
jgi:general secretion pathway protein N